MILANYGEMVAGGEVAPRAAKAGTSDSSWVSKEGNDLQVYTIFLQQLLNMLYPQPDSFDQLDWVQTTYIANKGRVIAIVISIL